jgi:uncharacterized protein
MRALAAPLASRRWPKAAERRSLPALAALVALLAALLAIVAPGLAHAAFVPPPLTGHVVDASGKLATDEVIALDQKLDRLRRETGFEIVAFLPASLGEETIEDVAFATFNTWGIGRKGADNGVLLVIAPNERKVRIETGKGVGGALTDLQSNDIIRGQIAPLLRAERYRDAVDRGTTAIAQALVAGTPESERPRAAPTTRAPPDLLTIAIGAGALLLVIILAIVSPAFRAFLWFFLRIAFFFGGRGGGGGGGGSGYQGGGGRSGGGGSSDDY